MKERPILFKADMVNAILEGRKTQTRRPIKEQPKLGCSEFVGMDGDTAEFTSPTHEVYSFRKCPYGKVGDQLWVRETFAINENTNKPRYKATDAYAGKWRPSIFMPRWASRIDLIEVDIRVERINDISLQDAIAEGVKTITPHSSPVYFDYLNSTKAREEWFLSPVDSFRSLWESINGKGSWDENPWVWVVEFKRIKP